MGGGHISCGDFTGEDKSGSAIFGVLDELPLCVSEQERITFVSEVIEPLHRQLDETGEYFLIERDAAIRMQPAVESLFVRFKEQYGDATVWDAIEQDDKSTLDLTDVKWGKGAGWQYYCVTDLRIAIKQCIETDVPVCVTFD